MIYRLVTCHNFIFTFISCLVNYYIYLSLYFTFIIQSAQYLITFWTSPTKLFKNTVTLVFSFTMGLLFFTGIFLFSTLFILFCHFLELLYNITLIHNHYLRHREVIHVEIFEHSSLWLPVTVFYYLPELVKFPNSFTPSSYIPLFL